MIAELVTFIGAAIVVAVVGWVVGDWRWRRAERRYRARLVQAFDRDVAKLGILGGREVPEPVVVPLRRWFDLPDHPV